MAVKSINIGNKEISNSSSTYFIADIAANHDGSLDRAKNLIELAKNSGADAAKFQNFTADLIVSRKGFDELGSNLAHQKNWKKDVIQVYKDASLPKDWIKILSDYCEKINIDFLSTPYDFDSIDLLDEYVEAFKIGSGDITWLEEIKYICEKGKPIFLATGASEIEDVNSAVNIIRDHDLAFCVMQCNTNYTASNDNFKYINLNVIKQYKKIYPDAILGLSDHTLGDVTVLGAVALGARVIEKHFTDDNNREGPDHFFSMNPKSWSKMVARVRDLEDSLGDGIKKVEFNEKESIIVQRRSVRMKKNKKKGEIISRGDLSVLRPSVEGSIPANQVQSIIGRKINKDFGKDELIRMEDIY